MAHIWTFSPSSDQLLQRCIDAALLRNTENKWTEKFGRKNAKIINKPTVPEEETPMEIIEIDSPLSIQENIEKPVNYDDFFDAIENEIRIDLISEECARNPDLINKMAEILTQSTVQKLFTLVFSSKTVETTFLNSLFYNFLPTYFKQQYSRLCLELLVKTGENYPVIYQRLLKILLEDSEIPNNMLTDYVSSLNEEKCQNFLENLTYIDLSLETFIRNILAIEIAYRTCLNCEKSVRIQEYIKSNLIQHSEGCATNKQYGRLFMNYLQAERSTERKINVGRLRDCLKLHTTALARPCLTMLQELDVNNS